MAFYDWKTLESLTISCKRHLIQSMKRPRKTMTTVSSLCLDLNVLTFGRDSRASTYVIISLNQITAKMWARGERLLSKSSSIKRKQLFMSTGADHRFIVSLLLFSYLISFFFL